MCDICDKKEKSINKRINWKGLVVCPECWEPKPRHEYPIKHRQEMRPIPNARPRQTDNDREVLEWEAWWIEWDNEFNTCTWEGYK